MLVLEPIVAIGGLADLQAVILRWRPSKEREFGLRAKRITGTAPENLTGYWLKKGTCSEAELFNYSSTVAGFGENPMILIRMAELYLISAEAWNEYLDAPDEEHVYKSLNVVRKRAGIPDVEVSWAGARNRNNVKTKAGMREIIRQEWNIEYMFEGMRFWNLRRWKIAEKELNDKLFGWKVAASDQKAFYNNGNGPVVVESNREFVAPRDYFWPIKSEETFDLGYRAKSRLVMMNELIMNDYEM